MFVLPLPIPTPPLEGEGGIHAIALAGCVAVAAFENRPKFPVDRGIVAKAS
ncbi:MAG: hypothetical protein PHV02_19290 [Rhodocyclaceae bacterium]|nr:hypothetical protein [Rhodocyclaceae bacterium]